MPREMEISTPLGEDVLFHSMYTREELSALSEYALQVLSSKRDLDLDKILGENVTVKVALPNDTTRYFNGYVTRFTQGGMYGRYHVYSAIVRPWLWFLTRTADCRIFQEMTVPDIVKQVFADHSTADFQFELTGAYRKWTYCVQYRETDFNFVSRLLEHEGIYYYTRHTEGHHTLVLTDSTSKHSPTAGYEQLPFVALEQLVRPELEHINTWEYSREIQPGVYVHDDYDLERPSVELKAKKALSRGYPRSDYEIYDYPGLYAKRPDGEQYAAVRIDELGSQYEAAQVSTNAKGVCVGSLFTLEDFPREDQNREHLIVAASHQLEFSDYEAMPERAGAQYRCNFAAMTSRQQFRPKRTTPKPFVQGPQTAMVVGPAGDEIYTDNLGRVKVQFHWDRYGQRDQNSSCWIRVSHPWAGKGWGAVATPRIGQEVIVDFLEGDPDQPIITGRVYNAESQPPFGFPAGAVLSGVKSDTHKGNGYNEMSFDDTAGTEKITIHGQYDMNTTIEHDQTSTIHNNRTDRIDVDDSESVGNNQTWEVGGNRDSTVGANETATVALQRTRRVGVNETISIGAAQEITVGGIQAIAVGASQEVRVGANQSTSVEKNLSTDVGADETRSVTGGRISSIGKDDSIHVGKNFILDADDSVTIRTGSASIVMKKDGTITIKGKDIAIQGSGKIGIKASSDVVVKGSKVGIN
jgi:type VI secretion system secreted protein VgrG